MLYVLLFVLLSEATADRLAPDLVLLGSLSRGLIVLAVAGILFVPGGESSWFLQIPLLPFMFVALVKREISRRLLFALSVTLIMLDFGKVELMDL